MHTHIGYVCYIFFLAIQNPWAKASPGALSSVSKFLSAWLEWKRIVLYVDGDHVTNENEKKKKKWKESS